MKRLSLLVAMLALAAVVPAGANHGGTDTFVATGHIEVNGPATRNYAGISELDNPCTGIEELQPDVPPGTFQGLDGYWILLPVDAQEHDAILIPDDPDQDVDAWFYTDACTLIKPPTPGAYDMAGSPGQPGLLPETGNEVGTVPPGAGYVVVDLYHGIDADFTFKVFNLKLTP